MKQMDRRLLILMRLRQETPLRAADLAEVLAVGGTNRGADTAAIVVSTHSTCFFSLQPDRRFQVKEILAMPRNKVWRRTMFGGDWQVEEREPQNEKTRRSK